MNAKTSVAGHQPMTKAQWAMGSSIMLAAFVAFMVSGYFVDAAFPAIDHAAESATPTRVCTDINGMSFRWSWPNAPFGASCGDGDRRP